MSDEYIKSVRLNEASQRALLSQMESKVKPVEESHRSEDRQECHLINIPVQVTHPDGGFAKFLICMRNISSGGLSFVHGGFLYPQSEVTIHLPTIWGSIESIKGKVVNCRHVEGQNHEIGVQFDKPIDRRRYLTLPGETPLDPDPDTSERDELAGRVLYVGGQGADTKLVGFHLKDSRITLESATSCDEAADMIKSSAIDLIMISSEIEGPDGAPPVETIRSSGFKGPIILVVNSADSQNVDALCPEGSITALVKPYSPAALIGALSKSLSGSASSGDGPIYSELANNPDAVELVEYYLGYVEEITGQLRDSIEKDEFESALQSCRTLMETGTGYGFTPISSSAKVAVTELSASMSINESISEIQRLLGVCSRISARDNQGSDPKDEDTRMVS